MANVSIALYSSDPAPSVTMLTTAKGERFLSVDLGGASVMLPGFDAECQRAARTLALELLKGAAQMDEAASTTVTPTAPEPELECSL